MEHIIRMNEFWNLFLIDPLCKTGFAPYVIKSQANEATDLNQMIVALSYLQGVAECLTFNYNHSTPKWHIANLVGEVAKAFRMKLESDGLFEAYSLSEIDALSLHYKRNIIFYLE